MKVVDIAQMRAMETAAEPDGLPGPALMEIAGRAVADVLAEADTGLTGDEIEAALDPSTYVGSAGAFVDRALARYVAEGGDGA